MQRPLLRPLYRHRPHSSGRLKTTMAPDPLFSGAMREQPSLTAGEPMRLTEDGVWLRVRHLPGVQRAVVAAASGAALPTSLAVSPECACSLLLRARACLCCRRLLSSSSAAAASSSTDRAALQ